MKGRRRLAEGALAIILVVVAGRLLGVGGLAASALLAVLVLAWRFDDELGTCFPLAVLFLLALAVVTGVFVLAGLQHMP